MRIPFLSDKGRSLPSPRTEVVTLLSSARRFVAGLPWQLLFLSILLPVAGFAFGYYSGFTIAPENTRLFLSALAGAQAAVLAIVFSVTVIGVQLVGTRYSPRMISLFTDSPVFIFTYALFVASVSLDLFLLYTVPSANSAIHSAGVGAASGFGLAAAVALYRFVKTAIRQSTPDGAIDAFVSRMSVGRYLVEARKSAGLDSGGTHPLHPLYNLTMNALSDGERVTTGRALSEYGDLAKSVLSDLDEDDSFENEDQQVVNELFRPVLTEHLKEIALHAEELDENSIAINAVDLQTGLGRQALDQSNRSVAIDAQSGLSDVIKEAYDEDRFSPACEAAWRNLGHLLVKAAEKPDPETVSQIASSIQDKASQQLSEARGSHLYEHAMIDLYQNMVEAQEHLLAHYGDEVGAVDIDWQHEHLPELDTDQEGLHAVHSWRDALFNTTESFLEFASEEGRYPITVGNFKDSWKKICVTASQSPAEDYAVSLCQALIEIAVIDRTMVGEAGIPWSHYLGEVKHEEGPEIVDRAFDRMLDYEYVEEDPGMWVMGEIEEQRSKYYRGHVNLEDTPMINTPSDFPGIIEDIRADADERWQILQEG